MPTAFICHVVRESGRVLLTASRPELKTGNTRTVTTVPKDGEADL